MWASISKAETYPLVKIPSRDSFSVELETYNFERRGEAILTSQMVSEISSVNILYLLSTDYVTHVINYSRSYCFSILQAMESWAEPGNEMNFSV